MKKYKIILARLLVAVFSFVMFFTNVYANAVEYIFFEDYNNYATNLTPFNAEIDAQNIGVRENSEGNNKYLSLEGSDKVSITYNINAELNDTYFVFDLIVPEENKNTTISVVYGGKVFNAVAINSEKHILTTDGKLAGYASANKPVSIAFKFNTAFSRYSLYINDKLVIHDWYVSAGYPSSKVTAISVTSQFNKTAELKLDRVVIYKSGEYIKSKELRSNEYNTSVQELSVVDTYASNDTSAGYSLYTFSDFDGDYEAKLGNGFQMYPYTNSIEQIKDEITGNGYICFTGTDTSSDCFVDILLRNNSNVIVQFDLKSPTLSPVDFTVFDISRNSFTPISVLNGGQINAFGEKIGKLDKRKWTKVAMSIDTISKTADYYINGELVAEDISIGTLDFGLLTALRIRLGRVEGERKFMLDNFILALGNDYKDYSGIFEGEIYKDINLYTQNWGTKTAEAVFADFNAFHEKTGISYSSGVRNISENLPYYDGEVLMIPQNIALSVFETNISELTNETSQQNNGTSYFSVDDLAKKFSKIVTYIDSGLVLVGNQKAQLGKNSILKVTGYLAYTRPEAESLADIHTSGHPRFILNDQRLNKIKFSFGTEKYVTEWGNQVIEKADTMLLIPPYEHERADGLRISSCSGVAERVQNLSMAYLLTGKKEYVNRVWTEVEAVCNYPDWGQGIHALDASSLSDSVAMAYDWLYDLWTPEQKKIMEEAVYKFELEPGYRIYHGIEPVDHSWTTIENNWNAACNGSMASTAAVFYDAYPEVCADVIENALRCLEIGIEGFYPMGAWAEGTNYWGTTVGSMIGAADTLNNVFGTDFGISLAPSFDKTAEYTIYLCGPGGSNNYNDAGDMKNSTQSMTFWLASRFNRPDWAEARLYDMKINNTKPSVHDILYYVDCENVEGSSMPLDSYFAGDEVINMRSSFRDNAATFVSFHTGKNLGAEYHAHIDSGTFVLDMLGERFAYDLGAQDYNSSGMSDLSEPTASTVTRWSYYQLTPEGHNCIVINPDDSVGQNLYSDDKIDEFVTKAKGAYAISDISSAYEGIAESVKRGIMLADDRRSVIIRDEIELKGENNEVWWFMHTKKKTNIEFIDSNTATMEINGKKIKVMVLTDADTIQMSEMLPVQMTKTVPSEQYALSEYKKLGIKLTGSGKMNITVKFLPFDDPAANNPVENTPLAEWSIPDGDLIEMPKADMLIVDGQPIEDFSPDMKYYVVEVPFTASSMPAITASCLEGTNYIASNAKTTDDTASIRIYDTENPQRYSTYYIKFKVDMSVLNEYKLNVAAIEASAEPQPENNKNFAIDGSLDTRWSADGEGQWLILDLGSVKSVDYIGTAFMSGNARSTKYKLYISQDKNNWELIFDGDSSGETLNIELSPKISKNVRYIKFEGFGNSQNIWNSVTEIGAYKLP